MTQPEAQNERQFKVRARRRLLGAVALAVALTVVLPMILEPGPRRESSEVAVTIPSPDKAPPFTPSLVPPSHKGLSGETLDMRPGQVSHPANDVAKSAPRPAVPPPEPAKSAEQAAAPASPATPSATVSQETPPAEKSADGKFAVQLAVLASRDNVQKLQERLQQRKFRFYTESMSNPAGAVRIRVGPFTSRAEADNEVAKLKLAGFSGGVVVAAQ